MKNRLAKLIQEKSVIVCYKIFFVLMFIFLGIGLWKWKNLPPELPLFYSLPRSSDQLGTPFALLLLPMISLFLFALNLIFAALIYEKSKLASDILTIIGLIASLLLLMTYIKIIFLVT